MPGPKVLLVKNKDRHWAESISIALLVEVPTQVCVLQAGKVAQKTHRTHFLKRCSEPQAGHGRPHRKWPLTCLFYDYQLWTSFAFRRGDCSRMYEGIPFQLQSGGSRHLGYYLNKNIIAWRHFAVFGALASMPLFLASSGLRSLASRERAASSSSRNSELRKSEPLRFRSQVPNPTPFLHVDL